jgi:hypothetical protein
MRIHRAGALLGAAIAAAAGASALIAVPALASGTASGHPTHTLTFTAVPKSYHFYNKAQTQGLEFDKAYVGKKVIGYDIVDFLSATVNDVAIGLRHGFISGVFAVSSTGTITGRVTSGTGIYAGARGTIGGTASPKQAVVTITYRT